MFPNRVRMDMDTPSREPLVYLFIHSFIHSFMYVCRSPKKVALLYGVKHLVTVHGAPRRWKAYMQWGAAWFPKWIFNDTAITTPVPCSLRHDTFHLGLGRLDPR